MTVLLFENIQIDTFCLVFSCTNSKKLIFSQRIFKPFKPVQMKKFLFFFAILAVSFTAKAHVTTENLAVVYEPVLTIGGTSLHVNIDYPANEYYELYSYTQTGNEILIEYKIVSSPGRPAGNFFNQHDLSNLPSGNYNITVETFALEGGEKKKRGKGGVSYQS